MSSSLKTPGSPWIPALFSDRYPLRTNRCCTAYVVVLTVTPYLLKDKTIWLPNQVWASDITYIRVSSGTVYLVTIIDLYSRKVLSWHLSNTMDEGFCVAALEEAIRRYGIPSIFNTDQGSQCSSEAFLAVLQGHGIQISMDSKERALDNIYVERFWRSLKYENIYLSDYKNMQELKEGIQSATCDSTMPSDSMNHWAMKHPMSDMQVSSPLESSRRVPEGQNPP